MSSSLIMPTSSLSTSSSLIRRSPSEPTSSPLIVLSSTVPTSSPLLMPSVSAVQSPTLVLSPIPQRNVSSCFLSFSQFTLFPSSSPLLALQLSTSFSASLSPFSPLQPITNTDLSVSPYPSPSLEPPVPIIAAGNRDQARSFLPLPVGSTCSVHNEAFNQCFHAQAAYPS